MKPVEQTHCALALAELSLMAKQAGLGQALGTGAGALLGAGVGGLAGALPGALWNHNLGQRYEQGNAPEMSEQLLYALWGKGELPKLVSDIGASNTLTDIGGVGGAGIGGVVGGMLGHHLTRDRSGEDNSENEANRNATIEKSAGDLGTGIGALLGAGAIGVLRNAHPESAASRDLAYGLMGRTVGSGVGHLANIIAPYSDTARMFGADHIKPIAYGARGFAAGAAGGPVLDYGAGATLGGILGHLLTHDSEPQETDDEADELEEAFGPEARQMWLQGGSPVDDLEESFGPEARQMWAQAESAQNAGLPQY